MDLRTLAKKLCDFVSLMIVFNLEFKKKNY